MIDSWDLLITIWSIVDSTLIWCLFDMMQSFRFSFSLSERSQLKLHQLSTCPVVTSCSPVQRNTSAWDVFVKPPSKIRRCRSAADVKLQISLLNKMSVCLSDPDTNQNTMSFLSDTCSRREVQVKNLITMTESFIVRSVWSRVRRLLRLIQIRAPDLIHAPWRMNSLQMN